MKNEKSGLPKVLASIIMIPRRHKNTVKYEVDNNMEKVRKLKTQKSKEVKTLNKLIENNSNNIGFGNYNSINFFINLHPLLNNNNNSSPNNNLVYFYLFQNVKLLN